MARVHVFCPDTNITLSPDRLATRATGGGKAAILHLARCWGQRGHAVTVYAGTATAGKGDGFEVRELPSSVDQVPREDVAIYVSGSRGHFRDLPAFGQGASCRIFWINGPNYVEPPTGELHWYVAPARFLADRAIRDWHWPACRIVVIRGDAVQDRLPPEDIVNPEREPQVGVWASHPNKGLETVLELYDRLLPHYPSLRLQVFGSERLWHDRAAVTQRTWPSWVSFQGEVPPGEVRQGMLRCGFLPYLSRWVDGFSCATAEALSAGVVVIAAGHGANAEIIDHGANGFLVPVREGQLDLAVAEDLLRSYLADPAAFVPVRLRAAASVPTWQEQAVQWEKLWQQKPFPRATA